LASVPKSGVSSIKPTRNSIEYEGALHVNKRIVVDLLKAAGIVHAKVESLGPVPAR
jgi:hypothetical protein